MIEYGKNSIGSDTMIFDPVILGFPSRDNIGRSEYSGCRIGHSSILRPYTTIYCDVAIGDYFQSGHNVLIRENTLIGDGVLIGSNSVIEGNCTIGNKVSIQSGVFVPTQSEVGDEVFIGPGAILTNDRYPPSDASSLKGPKIEDCAVLGAGCIILPAVIIGKGSMVAAGAIVTKNVPPRKLAIGSPAKIRNIPNNMRI